MIDPLIGSTLAGRYLVLDRAGESAIATAYGARYTLTDRLCAVSVLKASFASDAAFRDRFRREVKSTQRLLHPNIVEIFDQGATEDGAPYVVMERLDGKTLEAWLREGPFTPNRAVPVMIQVARAMARAHDLGALHGDLKSDNIVIVRRADGTDLVKVLDFGIPLSHADALPRHRAGPATGAEPAERVRLAHAEAGASDDLHALGVVFSKMTRSVDSRVEDRLDGLVLHLLQDDPRARPVDAHRVERDLIEIAHALGAALPPDPEVDPASTLAPARALPGARTDAWLERLAIFEAMSSRAYGAPVKADVDSTLAELRALVRKYAELRSAGTKQQRALDEIEARGREGRQRFGFAVDATGLDVSRARDELRSAVAEVEGAAEETKACARAYVRAQDELLAWEGRTAQREPHRELGQAHRTCAAAADGWLEARVREREAQRIAAVKERAVNDLDYQIAELRAALSNHEQGIDRDRDAAQRRIVDLTAQMERIDRRLVELATGFCAPLRGRPELGDLFGSLESRS